MTERQETKGAGSARWSASEVGLGALAVAVLGGLIGIAGVGLGPLSATVFSSWAEIHGALMGVAFGLFAATASRVAPARWWLFPAGALAGLVVGLNLNVSPWQGWWHAWYVLVPFAALAYAAGR